MSARGIPAGFDLDGRMTECPVHAAARGFSYAVIIITITIISRIPASPEDIPSPNPCSLHSSQPGLAAAAQQEQRPQNHADEQSTQHEERVSTEQRRRDSRFGG